MEDIIKAIKNKTADVLYYNHHNRLALYYLNNLFLNEVIESRIDQDKCLVFRSFNEAAKHLDNTYTDGVMIYKHDDGPYLVVTHLNDLMHDLWVDNTADCRGDTYYLV